MVLVRLSWHLTCLKLNYASFCLLTEQKSFLWTDKEDNLVLHPVVGLVLQVRDMEKFPHALGFESLDPFFKVSKQGPCLTAVEEDGGDKRLYYQVVTCSQVCVSPELYPSNTAVGVSQEGNIFSNTACPKLVTLCVPMLPQPAPYLEQSFTLAFPAQWNSSPLALSVSVSPASHGAGLSPLTYPFLSPSKNIVRTLLVLAQW